MATKVAYTLREDKQGLQKQLGCMNGIFQLFDRRYHLGLHRCRSQNRLTQGQGENGEKEFKNSSEKAKEKNQKNVMIEKNQVSVESSRNSFSSSCSSTTFSSFDCSKRVQTEWQIPSGPTSPNSHKKQPDWPLQPPDIRDVVKDSMTREIRVTKHERVGPVMKHIDSPRPFLHQKSIQYDRKDQNLTKIKKISSNEVKEISRFSCDERESQYSLKSSFKVKELPRLSLDSKQNSNKNSMNESRSEPGSNKRPSSGVVARLMGLESLTTNSISEVETMKIKPVLSDPLVSGSRRSRNGDECKHNHVSVSPRVYLKQEGDDLGYKQPSVYGEMEKRLSALEFKASGKDLRALKQILEAMQMTKTGFENKEQSLDIHKTDQIGSPTVKGTSSPKRRETLNRGVKPAKMATESLMVIGLHKVNHKARKQVKDQTPKNNISKATGRTPRSLSPSSPREYQTKEKPVSSPRLQRSKNGIDKECFKRPSSDLSRVKKQSDLNTRHPKIKLIDPMQNKQSRRYSNEKRNISQDGHTVSLKSESKQEVTRANENNFYERLIEDKPMDELAKLTMEQASPVSVLDAFYVEEIPSPVKKKQNAFNDYDNLHVDETEWNQAGIYNLMNTMDADNVHEVEFLKSTDREAIVSEIAKSPCKSTNGDHLYINEILLASGFLQDPDSAVRIAQLHSTGSMIQPELFDILEKPNDECHNKNPSSKYNEKIRRRMIFDSVNDILFHKLANYGFSGERRRRLVNGDKLLRELWSEIDNLQSSSERCVYDEDDEVKNLVSADVNKNLEGWERCCYDVSGLVLDIERLIFKDLIDEVVNADATGAQHQPGRHCRRLFSM